MPGYRPYRRLWGGLAAIAVAVVLYWLFRPPAEVPPAPPNPFVRELAFNRVESDAAIPELIDVQAGTGFHAAISFLAADDRPASLDGAEVRPPDKWPLAVMLYPRGSSVEGGDTVRFPCNRVVPPGYKPPMAPFRGPPPEQTFMGLAGAHRIWFECGYKAAPTATETWPAEEHRFSTYLAAPTAEPGEYVYELTLYPTCHWKSSIRYEAGTGVVLQRGILRIIAEAE